ncbi:MAG TPA: ABC transporter substrate-binding protein [Xanthobacteraceae bacterium]|jgi:ABC-type nitrate/sulfonate/bicarbonate transport system substrate-binding protein|nr:ABC transporter substrate-binding protein [Xanthobacteraceae bacterium]
MNMNNEQTFISLIAGGRLLGALALSGLALLASGTIRAQEKPAAGGALTPLTVELGDVSLTKLPFIMAADNGIYEKNGLKVSQYITPGAAQAVRGSGVIVPPENIKTMVGEINIGGGSPTMVRMTSVATAPHRVILATTDDVSRFHVISRADITDPHELKGKRIGYGNLGALDHFSMILFLRKLGLDPERDVSMFSNGNGPQSIAKGLVDAFAGTDIALTAAKQMGLRDLVDLGQYHFVMPGSGVNALAEWLPSNRDTAARFMRATVEAIALMKTDKKAAFASMTKWYGISDPAKLEAVYAEASQLPRKPYPSIEGLKVMQTIYTWREMVRHQPEDFTDPSFIAALDTSGYIDSLYHR